MRPLLLVLVMLAGCAHAGDDARRAELDPDASHFAPGLGEPDPLPKPNPPAVIQLQDGKTCVGECAKEQGKPCGGRCGAGEYCDTSSGMDRCQKDVVPAAAPH